MKYGNSLYAQASFGEISAEIGSGEISIDLMMYLPIIYQNIREMKELQVALGHEVSRLVNCNQDIINQCFLDTATWGLDRWEKVYGINTDKSKSFERRREIILAKLRGSGTTTKEMIKNVAIAFTGGEVSILEYPQEYRFVVQFIGVKGIPQNMAGLIKALNEIKPAHLAYSFKYTYTVWDQLKMSWSENSKRTWGDLKIYEGE